jgi:hypothetical protein
VILKNLYHHVLTSPYLNNRNLSKLVRKQKATLASKNRPFHGNVMPVTLYSAENPWQSSRGMKFNSVVLCFVTRNERNGLHLATFSGSDYITASVILIITEHFVGWVA